MKRYKISGLIFLDFLTPQEQVTLKFRKGEGFVEWDEKNTIWYVNEKGDKEETINSADIIEMYIEHGALTEIK